jgi:hypothetical protein
MSSAARQGCLEAFMRRTFVPAVVLVVAAGTLAQAQGKPDFSGTWALDVEKSRVGGRAPAGGGAGARPQGGGPARQVDARLVIRQSAVERSIDQQVNGKSNLVTIRLDGSESANAGMLGGQVTSKAHWDGSRLIVESTLTMLTPQGARTLQTTESRSLGPDGTMIVERTSDTPRGRRTQKLVFKKAT